MAPTHPLLDSKTSSSSWKLSDARVPLHVTDPTAAKRPALCSLGPSCPHSCLLPLPPSSSIWALLSSHIQLPTIPEHPCHFTPLCQGYWALPGNTCPFPSLLSNALLILQGQTEVLGPSPPTPRRLRPLPAPLLCMAFSMTRQEALKDNPNLKHPDPQHLTLLRTELMLSECGCFCPLNSKTLPYVHQTPALPPITGLPQQLALPVAPPARQPHDHLS